jgi:3',5'-cyclic AMP phosphodiesterase CpdA
MRRGAARTWWLLVLGLLAACGGSGGGGDVADAADVEALDGTDPDGAETLLDVPTETPEDDGAGEAETSRDAADAEAEAEVPACVLTGERCFSFAQVTDLHVGELTDDYGTPGWDDGAGEEDERTATLRFAVSKINMAAEEYDIRFVAATGDYADSGERSEALKAREILDQLRVPYLPVIGNHDLWPHAAGEEAPDPVGDRFFEEVFADQFLLLGSLFDGFTKAPVPTVNPDCGCSSHFQNYGFDHEGFHFVVLDLVTRNHAPFGFFGVTSEEDLHDFPGGTWPWLQEHLAATAMPEARNTFVFLHHPPVVTTLGVLDCLSIDERDRMDGLLRTDGIRGAVWGFFVGHHHVEYVLAEYDDQHVVVMPATKEDAAVRVIQLFGDGRVEYGTFL